jgi:hypothetical protein
VIDRILRGDDEKGRLQGIGLSVRGDAPLGHGFQQRRLRPWRGAIDFVGEQRLGKDRAGTEFEFGGLLIEN